MSQQPLLTAGVPAEADDPIIFKKVEWTKEELIRGGRILADMHYFMHDDLRNFCESLSPFLRNEDLFHISRKHVKKKALFIMIFGYVLPSIIPTVFTRALMSWPLGILVVKEGVAERIVVSNLYVNTTTWEVMMHTSPLKLQAFLADPLLSLLMIPVILLFIFIIGTVQHQLKKLGVHGRQFQHSFDFKAKSMLMNKLKKTRLISNSFFEAVVWGYYGIVCTICLFSFQQRSLGGAVVAYAAGELYLLVAENVVGFTAGHEGTLMIEAFGKTIELSHNGLWERLNRCTTSVFATTASQIMDVYHHTALRNWSDKKLKEKNHEGCI